MPQRRIETSKHMFPSSLSKRYNILWRDLNGDTPRVVWFYIISNWVEARAKNLKLRSRCIKKEALGALVLHLSKKAVQRFHHLLRCNNYCNNSLVQVLVSNSNWGILWGENIVANKKTNPFGFTLRLTKHDVRMRKKVWALQW